MNTADRIPIDSVLPGESPRFTIEDKAHIARLAETDATLPPILIHRQTMRVIDGLHRLRAAQLKGEDSIAVEYFDGTEEAAYLLSVEANIAHGLPLTVSERKAAAERIVTMHPEMSDRSIARNTGLSAKTVSEIRRRSTGDSGQSDARVGRDGRLRPVNADEGRRRVAKVIRERPDASLREIAQAAGVSVSTAHGVRCRIRDEEPVQPGAARTGSVPAQRTDSQSFTKWTATTPPAQSGTSEASAQRLAESGPARRTGVAADPAPSRLGSQRLPAQRRADEAFAGLERLRRDPSLRFTDSGRALLTWLHQRLVVVSEAEHELQSIPPHLLTTVSALALECADNWRELATELRGRARQIG
ncbi:ParB N-terminal domain-containing protein [Kitasatospora acidiphila]|uniref:ParB N-terminal domain-containing protein n=1 Tax=Kitasatospora acidiphila TaxID=2567942 RepID=UPI003C728D42